MINSIYLTFFRYFILAIALSFSSVFAETSAENNINSTAAEIVSLSYIEDSQRQLSENDALLRLNSNQAETVEDFVFNLGSHESHYWLLLKINNNSDKALSQKLLLSVPYRLDLQAFLIGKTKPYPLLITESQNQSFSMRSNSFRWLNSKLFDLQPKETAQILFSYETRGSTFLPISIKSQQDFTDTVISDNTLSVWFYAVGLSLGVLFLLLTLIMKSHIGTYYSILFLLGLFLIATIDGYSFKFLWPNLPEWNQNAAVVILLFINSLGFYFSNKVSNLKSRQRLFTKIAMLFALINIILIFLVTIVNFSSLVATANILLFLMFLFNVIAISSWITSKRNKLTTMTMVIVTLFIGILAVLFFFSHNLPDAIISYANYVTYLLIGIAVMAIISAQMIGLRKDHETALENQLLAVQREAEMNKSLFEAEKNYSKVREVARLRQLKLATASHDIRQPLISLRSTMDSISHKQSPEIKQQLHDAFDYMEQLCNSYLKETRPESLNNKDSAELELKLQTSHSLSSDAIDENNIETTHIPSETEPYPVSLVLSTIKQMFETEATDKGLEFRMVNSSYVTQVPPLVLMRIVSNFTSNAIKNTNEGKVLVGCRRIGEGLRIEVHDTGTGIKKDFIKNLQQAYKKGENSTGEGLGLAIVKELAEQHDLKLSVNSIENKGSCFTLEI